MDDQTPDTQPAGALVPPPHRPPTALATADLPLPPSRPRLARRRFVPLLDAALDELDRLVDRIAAAAGLR